MCGVGIGGAISIKTDAYLSCEEIKDLEGLSWSATYAQFIGFSISGGFWSIDSFTVPPMGIWFGIDVSINICRTWVIWSNNVTN